jgi:hypothetical protein
VCFTCHRGHPIWDTYPNWPGFYGSRSGYVKYDPRKESEDFETFVKTNGNQPIYKNLEGLARSDRLSPEYTGSSLIDVNAKVTEELNKINIERILRNARKSPDFPIYESALKAATHNRENFVSLLPGGATAAE